MLVKNENAFVVNLGGSIVISPGQEVEVDNDNKLADAAIKSKLLVKVTKK